MLVLWLGLWIASSAWASDAELLVEQAKSALAEDEAGEALALAREAIGAGTADWTAYRVYLRAAELAGVAERAEADFSELRTTDDLAAVVWSWWRVNAGELALSELARLSEDVPHEGSIALAWATARHGDARQALDLLPDRPDDEMVTRLAVRLERTLGRTDRVRQLAGHWLAIRPERPDVLDELWPGEPDRRLLAARRKVLRSVERHLPRRWDDPLYLHRALRLLAAADQDDAAREVANRLAELGYRRPLYRGPWNATMRRALGRTLALSSEPELPQATRGELVDIVEAMSGHALARGRPDIALAGWEELRAVHPGVAGSLGQTKLLIGLERWEEALELAREAQAAAASPAWDDLSRLQTARQAEELTTALGYEAEALLALRRGEEAIAVSWLARLLDPHPQWDALWMRAQASLGPATTPHAPEARALALEQAERLLADDPGAAATRASDVLRAAGRLDPDGGTGTVEETLDALRIRARATRSPVDATLLTLLAPDDPGGWLLRGELQEQAGHRHAAFASYAVAQGLGLDTEAALARVYDGLASPELGAMAVVARWGEARHAERLHALHGEEEVPVVRAPQVGKPMPTWSATRLDGAAIDQASLRGRVYVLSLWASWCGPCLIELPEIASTVAALRAEGLPVDAIAISVDDDERAAQRTAARQRWEGLAVGWTSDRTGVFRSPALPATWVVADDGTVVYSQIGYDEGFAERLARVLRKHAE